MAKVARPMHSSHPAGGIEVQSIGDPKALTPWLAQWHTLVERSLEPNVFFTPELLCPALHYLADEVPVRCLLLTSTAYGQQDPRLLGLLPMAFPSGWRRDRRIWLHPYAYLGTPLLDRDYGEEAIEALLDWAAGHASVLRLDKLVAGGAVHRLLFSAIQHRQLPYWVQDQYYRASFSLSPTANDHLRRALSSSTRKNMRRKRRRLEECGAVSFDALSTGADPTSWIEEFLRLEASGWKGRAGSALAQRPPAARFFREAAAAAHARGGLLMYRLTLDGLVIASASYFVVGDAGFGFKIAYDEAWHHYSPGVLLEIATIEHRHRVRQALYIDSCASPNHPMIDRLWDERRLIQSFWLSPRPGRGRLRLALLAAAYQMKHLWRERWQLARK